jgi:hypothetical protein
VVSWPAMMKVRMFDLTSASPMPARLRIEGRQQKRENFVWIPAPRSKGAPQSGVVHQLSVHTVEGVVGPRGQVIQMVPQADVLVVEAKMAPRISMKSSCSRGRPAFTAFNQRTKLELNGEVSLLGGDEITGEKTGNAYFKVQITPLSTELSRLKEASSYPACLWKHLSKLDPER